MKSKGHKDWDFSWEISVSMEIMKIVSFLNLKSVVLLLLPLDDT